jgi:triacylglycerol lipase
MGGAKHIGRVGALAVALGVGMAVANTPAVAFAEPAGSSTSSSSDPGSLSNGSTSAVAAVPGTSASTPSAASESTAASTGSPVSQGGSTARSSHAVTRSAQPGVVVSTGGARTGSKASEDADTAPTETGESTSSSKPATPPASTPVPSDSSRSSAPDVIPSFKRSKASAAEVTPKRPTWPSAGTGQPSGSDAGTSAAASTAASDAVSPTMIDAKRVVADPVPSSAAPTPPIASIVTNAAATEAMSSTDAVVAVQQTRAPTVNSPTPDDVVSGIVSSLVSAVLSPPANNIPTTPVQPPTMWTLLAFVRREFEPTVSNESPTVNPLAGQVTNGLITPTLNRQSIDPAITEVTAPLAGVWDLTHFAQLNATAAPATFTGEPSIVSQVLTGVFRVVRAVGDFLGVDLTIPLAQLLSSDSPPWFTTLGLNVQRSEFEGMPVWTLQSPGSTSDQTVVAIHGGAFVAHVNIFNWLNYAAMARDTGATVIVPIYPLVPQGGTAGTVVPAMADLISSQIDQHGAENVSVYGDSAGGYLALAAVQELVRRGDPVPSHMVLISPPLDLTLSNPAIQFVDDPLFSGLLPTLHNIVQQWAGDLDLTDPLVSPLYGSLAGLPPTAVYFGSLEIFAPDGLVLQDKALATPGADFTFILRKGELHDWPTVPILPETQAVLPDIYQQLGLIGSEA